MHRYRCVAIVVPGHKKRPVWVEAEKPVPLKNVAPYEGRGRASGATGYRRENGRVVAGFPFSGECSIQPGGKGAQGGARMKRMVVLVAFTGGLLLLSSAVALAAINSIECPGGECLGTEGDDSMTGTDAYD